MKIPKLWEKMMDRAYAGTAAPRGAIKAKCLDCSNYDLREAENCNVHLCPLHAYNPYRKKALSRQPAASGSATSEITG